MNKNKINNFKRLANNRVNKALVMLKLIGIFQIEAITRIAILI